MENIRDILAALDEADGKVGGTVAGRLQAVLRLRSAIAALRADTQGFAMFLDAVEHAYRRGVKDGVEGRAPASGPDLANAFALYEADRRRELGLPPA